MRDLLETMMLDSGALLPDCSDTPGLFEFDIRLGLPGVVSELEVLGGTCVVPKELIPPSTDLVVEVMMTDKVVE